MASKVSGSSNTSRRLLDAIAALRSAALAPPGGVASRLCPSRQLTIMFWDLVGSTELSARLDPEDLREVIAHYHRTVTQTVAGFHGFVAKYMGDGMLIYFGHPRNFGGRCRRERRRGRCACSKSRPAPGRQNAPTVCDSSWRPRGRGAAT
jgi:class 3 adenylate cyclase